MAYISLIVTVAVIHFLAVVSPGPDFIMITRNTLKYSRKTGIYSALGLGLGILLHVTYSLVGIGLLISKSILLFSIIKLVGAGYLIYIGYKSIIVKKSHEKYTLTQKERGIPKSKALKIGFLTNATNPKASLFFLSL